MPSGSGNYLGAVEVFLRLALDEPAVEDFLDRVRSEYGSVSSGKAAREYAHVVIDLGLLDFDRGFVRLTDVGGEYLRSRDRAIVRRALENRIAGVSELLRELGEEPDRIGLLAPRLREHGFGWKGHSQVRYRLRWLEEVGAVERVGRGRPTYYLAR